MKAKNNRGESFESIAFNEVSIMRQTQIATMQRLYTVQNFEK